MLHYIVFIVFIYCYLISFSESSIVLHQKIDTDYRCQKVNQQVK